MLVFFLLIFLSFFTNAHHVLEERSFYIAEKKTVDQTRHSTSNIVENWREKSDRSTES